ncbi:MAG: hypothetical protein ACRCSG_04080 [Cellulosilyticaceae bacterium]
MANLLENKTKDEVLEILQIKGCSRARSVDRRLYIDIDLEDNSKETFIKVKHLLRFNSFWEYWHILNAHLADEWKKIFVLIKYLYQRKRLLKP